MEAAVTIAVEDAGPGLDPALGETVWEPSVGSAADSPGLGLAIVRALVEANGGSVRYQPDPDVRSRFVVTLPAAEHVS